MESIDRPYCVMTGSRDLEKLHTFSSFPVFMGCTDQDPSTDLKFDMTWWLSRSSGSLQLNPLVPLPILYAHSHNENVGQTWARHHNSFAEFIFSCGIKSAFEIGGAHGSLAHLFLKKSSEECSWTLIDPNPQPSDDKRLRVIKSFFDENFSFEKPPEAIVHSHVFEHMYKPFEFIEKIRCSLSLGQNHIFSIPNLNHLFSQGYTNALNFEHTFYLTEPVLKYFLEKSGFEIVRREAFENHSIFFHTRAIAPNPKASLPVESQSHREQFANFLKLNLDFVEFANRKIAEHDGDVFLFGAHIFTQFLIAFGLKPSPKIRGILDNGPSKIGKRLYGTEYRVFTPSELARAKNPAVILRAASYNEEIKNKIRSDIKADVTYWE